MIINFSIENFRSIKDRINLSFEASNSKELEEYYVLEPKQGVRLLKLALIYGPNASGKTNILLALDYLRKLVLEPFNNKAKSFDLKPFLFSSENIDKNTVFSLEFIQNGVKYLYEVELNQESIIKEVLYFHNPNKALIYKRKTNTEKQIAEVKFGSKIKISKEEKDLLIGNTLWNNTVLGGYLKTNIDFDELQDVVNWFKTRLLQIVYPKTKLIDFIIKRMQKGEIDRKIVVNLLKRADFSISDIVVKKKNIDESKLENIFNNLKLYEKQAEIMIEAIKENTKEIFLQHYVGDSEYPLSIEDESSGTKRYFELSGILSYIIKERRIMPIDELESSLHPDLIKHFLLTFLVNAKNSQIIATTHHRELLMERDILRNDVIWFTDKKRDDSTDLFSLADFHSSVIRNTSSVYKAYKIGKLGAIPNLQNYYIDWENEKK